MHGSPWCCGRPHTTRMRQQAAKPVRRCVAPAEQRSPRAPRRRGQPWRRCRRQRARRKQQLPPGKPASAQHAQAAGGRARGAGRTAVPPRARPSRARHARAARPSGTAPATPRTPPGGPSRPPWRSPPPPPAGRFYTLTRPDRAPSAARGAGSARGALALLASHKNTAIRCGLFCGASHVVAKQHSSMTGPSSSGPAAARSRA